MYDAPGASGGGPREPGDLDVAAEGRVARGVDDVDPAAAWADFVPLFVTVQLTVIGAGSAMISPGRRRDVGGRPGPDRGPGSPSATWSAVLFVSPVPAVLYSKTLFAGSVVTVTVRLPTLAEPSGMVTISDRPRLAPGAMSPSTAGS